jgi:hypothetical protein
MLHFTFLSWLLCNLHSYTYYSNHDFMFTFKNDTFSNKPMLGCSSGLATGGKSW